MTATLDRPHPHQHGQLIVVMFVHLWMNRGRIARLVNKPARHPT